MTTKTKKKKEQQGLFFFIFTRKVLFCCAIITDDWNALGKLFGLDDVSVIVRASFYVHLDIRKENAYIRERKKERDDVHTSKRSIGQIFSDKVF